MSGRDVTTAVSNALQSNVIRPVLIGKLDFESDPVLAWTGPNAFAPSGTGDTALDGEIFLPFAPFLKLSNITENQQGGGPTTLTLSGHDLDEVALRQVINDKRQWRGRGAWLWLGLLTADESTVIADPVRIKSGVMTNMTIMRDRDDYTVGVTIDTDLGQSRTGPWRILDHVRIFPSDTFSTFLVKLANKPQGLDRYDVNPNIGIEDAEAQALREQYSAYGEYRNY